MEVFQELRKPSVRLECDHCSFRGTDYENVQIHMGTIHPEFCDEMDAGGLDTGGPPSASSPESPVLAASPESWGLSPTASPESRKPTRTASPEPKKPSPSESPEPWKPFPAVSPEPRRPAPAVSPGSWKPGPPGSPRPWKSSPSASSGPWKPTKPAPSVSPGPWKPIPSISPGPWKPAPSVSPASWKSSSVSSGSWKTPPTSPESWKSGPPELRKSSPALSPEHWKAVPPVSPELRRPGPPLSPEIHSPAGSPELRKPSGSPDLWKLSSDQRKTSPASFDFSESQKSSRGGSPDLWKSSFVMEPQKPAVFPETRKPGPSGSSESPRMASDIWKPVLSIDAESRKSALFPEPTRAAPPASPEPRKRVLFPESRKHALFPELPKSAVFSEAQKAAELGDELQIDAAEDQKCDLLVQEGLLATPKKLLEDALFPSSKKLKKDSQESSDAELSSSEYLRADLDAIDMKGQESSSDQEQVDVESIDFGKENKMDMTSPEQSRNVLQFTEEKEAFISEEEIAKYMKRGKGKYYCKICCCRAMKKGAVLHHLVNKHNVHSPYKCTICGKAFLLESLLKNHVAAHGQSLLKCPRCNFESNFPRGFKKHLTHCQSRHNEEANKKLMEALESSLEEPQI
ncbi:chromosome alignment-maintaining phosphoprotein 1 isoform 2-T4 [Callospermophilus lateralis]|uniref:chromosome alignment-maintaining phosphoprotein 1 isoform X2 n=1 Tax=Callospermophilus lateralis TaxID=76772 RepID=UPI0040388C35